MHPVTRTWLTKGTRTRVCVTTEHPIYGPVVRGRIRCTGVEEMTGPGPAGHLAWALTDYDHCELDPVVGDYMTAEKALLAATTALEE